MWLEAFQGFQNLTKRDRAKVTIGERSPVGRVDTVSMERNKNVQVLLPEKG